MVIENVIRPGSGNPGFKTSEIEIITEELALNLLTSVELILIMKMLVFRAPLLILHYNLSDRSELEHLPTVGTPTLLGIYIATAGSLPKLYEMLILKL